MQRIDCIRRDDRRWQWCLKLEEVKRTASFSMQGNANREPLLLSVSEDYFLEMSIDCWQIRCAVPWGIIWKLETGSVEEAECRSDRYDRKRSWVRTLPKSHDELTLQEEQEEALEGWCRWTYLISCNVKAWRRHHVVVAYMDCWQLQHETMYNAWWIFSQCKM